MGKDSLHIANANQAIQSELQPLSGRIKSQIRGDERLKCSVSKNIDLNEPKVIQLITNVDTGARQIAQIDSLSSPQLPGEIRKQRISIKELERELKKERERELKAEREFEKRLGLGSSKHKSNTTAEDQRKLFRERQSSSNRQYKETLEKIKEQNQLLRKIEQLRKEFQKANKELKAELQKQFEKQKKELLRLAEELTQKAKLWAEGVAKKVSEAFNNDTNKKVNSIITEQLLSIDKKSEDDKSKDNKAKHQQSNSDKPLDNRYKVNINEETQSGSLIAGLIKAFHIKTIESVADEDRTNSYVASDKEKELMAKGVTVQHQFRDTASIEAEVTAKLAEIDEKVRKDKKLSR